MQRAAWAGVSAAALLLIVTGSAGAQPQLPSDRAGSSNLQGDTRSWRADPHLRTFYEAVKAACVAGCGRADLPALEARSRAIFADMARTRRMNVKELQDHLAGIPRQVIGIAREDPGVLASYEAFITALFGPE